jgi:pimeloyl-ACP methyl ester carboxylesterase
MGVSLERYADYLKKLASLKGLAPADFVLPQNRYIELGGMRFHYLEWGDPDRAPIVFLHGGAQTAHTWDVACLDLCRDFRCLAFDQRGHGDSAWAPDLDYSIPAHCRDIERFVDRLALERFALVGMSMGGIHAMAYAAAHSARLAALLLVDIGPDIQYEGAEQSISTVIQLPAEFPDLGAAVAWSLRASPERDPELVETGLRLRLRQLSNGPWSWKFDRRQFARVTVDGLLAERRYLWGEIHEIRCPALILRGAKSTVLLDEHAERLAAALPAGEWAKVEGAGHSIQSDHPKALAEAIARVLSRADGTFRPAARPG